MKDEGWEWGASSVLTIVADEVRALHGESATGLVFLAATGNVMLRSNCSRHGCRYT
jgi:hypothetical protein